MATFKMALDTRRVRRDATYPIVFKITVKRKQIIISTGVCVKEAEFCKRSGIVINSPDINNQLMRLENTYRSRFYEYIIYNDVGENLDEFKAFILNKPVKEKTIYNFWNDVIILKSWSYERCI